jgi:hypothetical protein
MNRDDLEINIRRCEYFFIPGDKKTYVGSSRSCKDSGSGEIKNRYLRVR